MPTNHPRRTTFRGINPYQLGLNSEIAFVHAAELVYRTDTPVFPSRGETFAAGALHAATRDLKELRRNFDELPECDYRGRTINGDPLWAVRFSRDRNVAITKRDTGMQLPKTQTIERGDGTDFYLLFKQAPFDPDFNVGAVWRGSDHGLVRSFPVPGSIYRGKRGAGAEVQRWRWRPGYGPDCPLLPLPKEWVRWLPLKITNPISATIKRVAEYKTPPAMVWDRRNRRRSSYEYDEE